MSSGNERSTELVTHEDDSSENLELQSVKIHLEEVMEKNEDLKEMLLFTTQELEKEKENSRKIVQTLTERLMESRETINKLEVENMRYKKDCMLALELLQCNRSVDQEHVVAAVKKLSDYKETVRHSPYPTGNSIAKQENDHKTIMNKTTTRDEKRNVYPSRPRTLSKRKSKFEATTEDTTALLAKQGGKAPESLRQSGDSSPREDKIHNEGDYKGLGEKQCEKTKEKTRLCVTPSMMNNNKQKQCDEGQSTGRERVNSKSHVNIGGYLKKEVQSLAKGDQPESERLIANDHSENTNRQVKEYRLEDKSCSKIKCFNDELSREDKALIVNEANMLKQQHFDSPKEWGNVNSLEEKTEARSLRPDESKNTGHGLQSDVSQSTCVTSPATIQENKSTYQEDTVNEHDKLILITAEEKSSQKKLPKHSTDISEDAFISEENRIRTKKNKAEVMVSKEDDTTSLDNSLSDEIKSNDQEINTTGTINAEDETLTAEENTPLV